jgi:hypothetical protein
MSNHNDLKCPKKCGRSVHPGDCGGGSSGEEEDQKQDKVSKTDHQNTDTNTTAISKSCQNTLCTILWGNQTAVMAAPKAHASEDATQEAETAEVSDLKTSDAQNTQESAASKPSCNTRLTM